MTEQLAMHYSPMFLVLLSACAPNAKITPELAEKVSTRFEYRENVFDQCRMRGLISSSVISTKGRAPRYSPHQAS